MKIAKLFNEYFEAFLFLSTAIIITIGCWFFSYSDINLDFDFSNVLHSIKNLINY